MSRQLTRTQAILLGLVVFGALALAGAGLFVVQDRAGWGQPSFHVHVGFPDIAGVEVGSRVRLQGIDAGEVEAIVPPELPGQPVRLRLRVAGKYQPLVRADARVRIASESLLAGKVVHLLPGRPDAEVLEDGGDLRADVQPDLFDGLAQAAGKLNHLLTEVDGAMREFRQGEGRSKSVTQELAEATRKLNAVLTKTERTLDTIDRGEGSLGKLVKDETLYAELTGTLAQVKSALYDVEKGRGTLGKLLKTSEAHSEAVASLNDVRRMVASVKQNSDAIKQLPVVRSYVVDPHKELVRPDMQRQRQWIAAGDLFEANRAVLTDAGKEKLDQAAKWLNEQKPAGSEVVVAAFAQDAEADFAQTLTQKQSEAVVEYLRGQHRVQRTGWWWWSNRTVKAVGCGNLPPVGPETERLPPARVELLVFSPPE